MENSNIINGILNLPKNFYSKGNKSIISLLEETRYFKRHNSINEQEILNELIKNPTCIKYWLDWSNDKRSSSGWYFKQVESGKYIVGYFPDIENKKPIEYSDSNRACASFIKLELEEILKSSF